MKPQNKIVEYSFTLIGLVLAVFFIAIFAGMFSYVFADFESQFNTTGNSSFGLFNKTQELVNYSQAVKNESESAPQSRETIFDIIGTYFSSGYRAFKTAVLAVGLAGDIIDEGTNQVSFLSLISTLFKALIGVIVALLLLQALLKWYI